MEPALESVVKDIRVGKILIQTNEYTSEPEVGTFHSNYMENDWELENQNQISCFDRRVESICVAGEKRGKMSGSHWRIVIVFLHWLKDSDASFF